MNEKSTKSLAVSGLVPKADIEEILKFKDETVNKMSPDEMRKNTIALRDNIDGSYFLLAGMVYQIAQNGLHSKWGFPTFREYVEQELGFTLRKAQYLMSIWHWYVIQIQSFEVMKRIGKHGWAKTAALVGAVTEQNVDFWDERAGKVTAVQLAEEVKAKLANVAAQTVIRMTFQLYEQQADTVKKALQAACAAGNTQVLSNALSLVALDYLSAHTSGEDMKRDLAGYLRRIESLCNVALMAVDNANDEIIYTNPKLEGGDDKQTESGTATG